ncbi:hypothetical protein [Methyloligella solikamskensis]|uniref:Uncharacterized protein n=1 Tax=Methyloligella solikamskensis TaxID=1177756 RepID=A0ABW3J8X5_9HYPH
MSFIDTVGDPVDIASATNGSDFIAQIVLGYLEDTGNTISVLTALSPLPGGDYEYIFAVVEADWESGEESRFLDGLDTLDILPEKADRELALSMIMTATDVLIEKAQIGKFFTYTPDVPDKSFVKYELIFRVFKEFGYTVTKGEAYLGITLWQVERVT